MSGKLTLYTNHQCPWAHRAHIAAAELGLEFEEVIIDLATPREPWYLKVNPRGQVPTLKHGDEIITESAIIAQYFADAFPDRRTPALSPVSSDPGAALTRARIPFFVDTFLGRVQSHLMKAGSVRADDAKGIEQIVNNFVTAAASELEPLLVGVTEDKPFFGGSKELTMAEVLLGSFLLRLVTLSKRDVYPKALTTLLPEKAPKFWAYANKVAAHKSVYGIYNEDKVAAATLKRFEAQRAAL